MEKKFLEVGDQRFELKGKNVIKSRKFETIILTKIKIGKIDDKEFFLSPRFLIMKIECLIAAALCKIQVAANEML